MQVQIPEPWLRFLSEVDQAFGGPVEVHCLGGFVLMVLHGLPRPTGDVDFIEIRPDTANTELIRIAGEDSEIGKRYKLHFHRVSGVADYPEGYESRLIDITPRNFKKLQLKVFELHDIVLAKVARNAPRDRSDVEFLAKKGLLDKNLLRERFEKELRPNLITGEARSVQTMELWLELLSETP
jgi:hypothetical protein